MSQKKRNVLANTKIYRHLNDPDLFRRVINGIASAQMTGDLVRNLNISLTELRMVKGSQEYWDFKEEYFNDIGESVEYSHRNQLKLFSKYDEIALRELLHIGLESDKEAFKIQALKTYLSHAGVARGQVQDKEYQQLREMVEELTTGQDDEIGSSNPTEVTG